MLLAIENRSDARARPPCSGPLMSDGVGDCQPASGYCCASGICVGGAGPPPPVTGAAIREDEVGGTVGT